MVIVDSHGNEDNFILPVDPKGTNGIDSKGNPMIVLRQPIKPLPAKMSGVQTVNHSAQTDAMIGAMLTQGQWYFQGRSWANTRIFRPDGTFYTQHRPGEGGTWKIIDGMVVLSFQSSETSENLLMLPIDPQLTIGQDPEGIPILVYQQPLSEVESTPAPASVRPAKSQVAKNDPRAGKNSRRALRHHQSRRRLPGHSGLLWHEESRGCPRAVAHAGRLPSFAINSWREEGSLPWMRPMAWAGLVSFLSWMPRRRESSDSKWSSARLLGGFASR